MGVLKCTDPTPENNKTFPRKQEKCTKALHTRTCCVQSCTRACRASCTSARGNATTTNAAATQGERAGRSSAGNRRTLLPQAGREHLSSIVLLLLPHHHPSEQHFRRISREECITLCYPAPYSRHTLPRSHLRHPLPLREGLRGDVLSHGHVTLARPEVLAERHDVAPHRPKVSEGRLHVRGGLADPEHERRLRDHLEPGGDGRVRREGTRCAPGNVLHGRRSRCLACSRKAGAGAERFAGGGEFRSKNAGDLKVGSSGILCILCLDDDGWPSQHRRKFFHKASGENISDNGTDQPRLTSTREKGRNHRPPTSLPSSTPPSL